MTKTKKIVMGTLFSILTLGGLASYAASGERLSGMTEEKAEFIMNRVSSKLELTDVQKQSLVALKDTLLAQKEIYKKSNPRKAILELLSEPVLDETKILALMNERTTQLHLAAPIMVSAIADFTNSLNAEQRTKIQDIASEFGEGKHRGGFFGRR